MQDPDSGVRYWGVMGVLMRGADEVAKSHAALVNALEDLSPSVRVAAAETLGRYGGDDDVRKALDVLIALADPVANHSYVAMHALNAIDAMGKKAAPLKQRLQSSAEVRSRLAGARADRVHHAIVGMAADHPLTTRSSL